MTIEPGWIFWVENDGRIRNFIVGEENEDAAKLAIQREHLDINFLNFISKQRAPAELIKFLKLTGGKVMEWVPAHPGDTISPSGVNIESNHDPLPKKWEK
jgi:hypothetical protein